MVEKNTGLLDDPDTRWELEAVVDRIRVRGPFLPNAFSRRAVNRRFRQDEHHMLMHQRL